MIRIYYATLSKAIHHQLMAKYSPKLSVDFRIKLLKYRRWQDAQLSLLGRLLLKYGFEKINESFSDKDLLYTEYDKPYLDEGKVNFNISHSGDVVIVVLTDAGEVGIDIEQMKEIDIEDFKLQMTDAEWQKVSSSANKKIAFYTYWTQKEAVLKAFGMGLSLPLTSFEVGAPVSKINEMTFFLQEVQIHEDYICHLALKEAGMPADVHAQQILVCPEKLQNYQQAAKITMILD